MWHFFLTKKKMKCKCCGKRCQSTLCKDCYRPFTSNDDEKSFAFSRETINLDELKDCTVLDLFDTIITNVDFSNFKNLKKLRLSHCKNLVSVVIKDVPTLEVLDLSGSKHLESVDLTGTPNIVALDASYCVSLPNFIGGSFNKCEFFSCSATRFTELPSLPSVKYVDLSITGISNIDILAQSTHLQYLIFESVSIKSFDMAKLNNLKELVSIKTNVDELIMTNYDTKNTKLSNIWYSGYKLVDRPNINCSLLDRELYGHKFSFPICAGDWHDSQRMLYGPWPSPPGDYNLRVNCQPVCKVPDNCNEQIAADIISGVFFGCAIGDCVGLHTERDSIEYINFSLDCPIDITWTHPLMTKRGLYFHRGSFTDDTALSLMFARSICDAKGETDPKLFGKWLHEWIDCGLKEHNDGSGIGQGPSTADAVHQPGYDDDPITKSIQAWEKKDKFPAGNGAVMKTGAVGCYKFWDEKTVIENAKTFAIVTHPHPYCIYGSILLSLLVSRFIQLRSGMIDYVDIDATIEECFDYVTTPQKLSKKEIKTLRYFCYARNLEDLMLDAPDVAPTLGTMGCGIWVLRKNVTYAQGIEAVIRAGGDTDTNGAVAGACLGAKLGYSAIPKDLIQFLWYRYSIRRDLVPFLNLMSLDFDPFAEYHHSIGEDLTLYLKPPKVDIPPSEKPVEKLPPSSSPFSFFKKKK